MILSTTISLKKHFIELGTCTLERIDEWVLVDKLCILEISQQSIWEIYEVSNTLWKHQNIMVHMFRSYKSNLKQDNALLIVRSQCENITCFSIVLTCVSDNGGAYAVVNSKPNIC